MPTRTVTVIRPQDNLTLKYRWPAVIAVRQAIKSGLFKQDTPIERKVELLKELGNKIIETYSAGMTAPMRSFTLEVIPDANARGFGGACYSHERQHIMLDKPSLVSFLHELAHHIQYERDGSTTENYAQRWSIGLFKRATPGLFQDAVNRGLLYHTQPNSTAQEEAMGPALTQAAPAQPEQPGQEPR